MTKFCLGLPNSLKMEVERISKERGESPTNTIREAIREYIKNYKVGGE